MKAPIHSIKHYVLKSNTPVTSGAKNNFVMVDSLAKGAARATTADVEEGAVIKAVYVEVWLKSNADTGSSTQQNFYIEKLPSGAAGMSYADAVNPGAYDNKKNILFSSQGVLGDKATQSIPVYRDWIKIPKGKQRFGLGDKFTVTVAATGFALQICGLATYKEYE